MDKIKSAAKKFFWGLCVVIAVIFSDHAANDNKHYVKKDIKPDHFKTNELYQKACDGGDN